MNFTGDLGYQPNSSWVSKRREEGQVAADLFVYVDNYRITGTKYEYFGEAYRRWGSVCTHMGIKDDLRKVETPSQQPGT